MDLKGRNLRTSKWSEPSEGVHFELGATTHVTHQGFNQESSRDKNIIVDTPDLPKAVRPGDIIAFNDGEFGAVVLEVAAEFIRVQFKEEGTILPGKSVRIPGHRLSSLPVLSNEDKSRIMEFAVGFKMDYVCVPNVTSVKDI